LKGSNEIIPQQDANYIVIRAELTFIEASHGELRPGEAKW
jgi:hypothetical protein